MIRRRLALLFVALLSIASARADSDSDYAAGQFSKVPPQVRSELKLELEDSQAFIAKIRLATHSVAQDSSIPLSEILSVYDAAATQAKKFLYDERMAAEKATLSHWMGREKSITAAEALQGLRSAIALPDRSIPELLKRSTELFAIATLARRKLSIKASEADWIFVAGLALDADSQSGETFFEMYLESPEAKALRYRAEALQCLERDYRRQYGTQLPKDIADRLKRLKSPAKAH